MKSILKIVSFVFIYIGLMSTGFAQSNQKAEEDKKEDPNAIYSGLKFRSIGPALMSGRISDIALHPDNENVWYVTVGSGGVWKTENAGTTWESLFDKQKTYSTGCISLDPQNPEVIWGRNG